MAQIPRLTSQLSPLPQYTYRNLQGHYFSYCPENRGWEGAIRPLQRMNYSSKRQDLYLTLGCLKTEASQISSYFCLGAQLLPVQGKHLTPHHSPKQNLKPTSPHS